MNTRHGPMDQYQKEFSKNKIKVLRRDKFECLLKNAILPADWWPAQCYGGLSVDHIHRRSTGGGNELENLGTVCMGHHDLLEALTQKKKLDIMHAILQEKYGYKYEEKSGDNYG